MLIDDSGIQGKINARYAHLDELIQQKGEPTKRIPYGQNLFSEFLAGVLFKVNDSDRRADFAGGTALERHKRAMAIIWRRIAWVKLALERPSKAVEPTDSAHPRPEGAESVLAEEFIGKVRSCLIAKDELGEMLGVSRWTTSRRTKAIPIVTRDGKDYFRVSDVEDLLLAARAKQPKQKLHRFKATSLTNEVWKIRRKTYGGKAKKDLSVLKARAKDSIWAANLLEKEKRRDTHWTEQLSEWGNYRSYFNPHPVYHKDASRTRNREIVL